MSSLVLAGMLACKSADSQLASNEPPPNCGILAVTVQGPDKLAPGDSGQFIAGLTKNRCGPPVAETFTWSVADTTIATVDANRGIVVAGRVGRTTVRAAVLTLGAVGAALLTVRFP